MKIHRLAVATALGLAVQTGAATAAQPDINLSGVPAPAIATTTAILGITPSPRADEGEKLVIAQRRGRRGARRRGAQRRGTARRSRRRSRRTRRIVGGIAAGIIAGIVASELARADRQDWSRRCRRWWRNCDNGNGRACRNFYRYCY